MGDENNIYTAGLNAAIDEVQRLRTNALSWNYKEAYVCALDEVLTYLKPMRDRAERGEYLHPTSSVMGAP